MSCRLHSNRPTRFRTSWCNRILSKKGSVASITHRRLCLSGVICTEIFTTKMAIRTFSCPYIRIILRCCLIIASKRPIISLWSRPTRCRPRPSWPLSTIITDKLTAPTTCMLPSSLIMTIRPTMIQVIIRITVICTSLWPKYPAAFWICTFANLQGPLRSPTPVSCLTWCTNSTCPHSMYWINPGPWSSPHPFRLSRS